MIQLPRDIDEIERAIAEFGDVGMLVIDPSETTLRPGEHSETDIRDAIGQLTKSPTTTNAWSLASGT